jgi:hypothetical protein
MSAAKIRDSQSDGDRHRDWNGATLAEPEKRNSPAANTARSRARNNPRNRRDNNPNRQNEPWPARHPTRPVWRKATGRDDAVQMQMVQHRLAYVCSTATAPISAPRWRGSPVR